MVEPFPGLEWSNFMENFDWTFDPEMLGVAAVG